MTIRKPLSPNGRAVKAPLLGVHRVRTKLANGPAEYWYAWRGGPRILAESAATERVLALQVERAAPAAAQRYHELKADRHTADGFVSGMVTAWQASPEFALLAPRTRADLRKHLSVVKVDLGTMRIAALKAKGARKALMDWRAQYAATPRTADHYVSTVSQMLSWAREQGLTDADPLKGWKRLYSVDRSAVVWEPDEIEAVCAKAEPELRRAILLAAYTGLRQGDLLRLTWPDIGKDTIVRTTSKRKRVVHVPLTAEVRALLEECPKLGPVILTDKAGKAWNVSTLEKRFSIARRAAGIEGKRWHDLRGTYATLLARAGVGPLDLARIMGWSKDAAEVVTSYVSGQTVALAVVKRLEKNGS